MMKIETIWHHLLQSAIMQRQFRFTQKELAGQWHYSLSTVNHALIGPAAIGAVRKESKFFILADPRKMLYYWASLRRLDRDILWRTHSTKPVKEIEGWAPPTAIFAAYSAARAYFKEPPADYDKVYLYLPENDLDAAKPRFDEAQSAGRLRRPANVFILKRPEGMVRFGHRTTLTQTFVDIWNLSDWFARDYTAALEQKINELLS